MDRNAYFTISTKDNGTYVTIYPKEGNGMPLFQDKIVSFLALKGFYNYKASDLEENLRSQTSTKTFKLSDTVMESSAAFCDYSISQDRQTVTATLNPPVGQGIELTKYDIEKDLNARQVRFGIKEDVIEMLTTKNIYNTPTVIAEGVKPIDGKDAEIEYLFNLEHQAKPKVNEDGTVDFHALDLISHVEAGAVVARIIPEEKGTAGKDVFGNEIAPRHVKKKNFKYGRNLVISDNGLELISKVSGHVTLEGGKVFVSDTYEIPLDVDASTGDIKYEGNVVVRGNIRSGYSVIATGNITVVGVVEGAYVEAGGDITINRGVQGMNKAELKAGKDIISKFIENANVSCNGCIDTDAIMHSNVSAKSSIKVHGKNGLIVGGAVRSGTDIEARQVGNEMGTVTNLYVGVDPSLRKRIHELADIIKKAHDDKRDMNQIITRLRKKQETEGKLDANKQEILQKSMRNMILLEQDIRKYTAEYSEGQNLLVENVDARIKVAGNIYYGTKLSFGDTVHYIKDKNMHCQYVKRGADVVTVPL